MYSEPVITPPTNSMYIYKPLDNEELASYQGLGHRNWFYDTTRHWPEPPRLTRSDLMPVPRQNADLLVPLGELAAEINEGGKIDILRLIEQHIPQGKPIYYGLALPVPTSVNEFILMYDNLLSYKTSSIEGYSPFTS